MTGLAFAELGLGHIEAAHRLGEEICVISLPSRSRMALSMACTVLAVGALAAAVLAYVSTQRAHRAERQAEETRIAANQARGHAEQLLGYLTDDFAQELGSFGRVDLVGELAKRQLDYFKALPPGLKDGQYGFISNSGR